MKYPLEPISADEAPLAEGDMVFFKKAPEALISGLPLEDQEAIKAQEEKPMAIVGFDEYGHVELEFTSKEDGTYKEIHTIWVAPKELFKA